MSDTVVTGAGIVADLEPYIVAAIGAIVTALGAFIAFQIQKYTGVVVQQATIEKVDKYIADKAAQAVAAAGDNLAKTQINVGSPMVADITDKVVTALPDQLSALGLTPEAVAHKITAAFGRLQSGGSSVVVDNSVTVPLKGTSK
ncbi:MAG: hypothetical protein KGL39_54110 [Patescibacteria group bacterium]|nr:hypothetical protein [Patescibacteria group bacterium]